MNPYLSNEMPELTEQELSWKGLDTVTYYDEKVKSLVSAKYQSMQSFIEHNNLPEEAKAIIEPIFNETGKFEMMTEHGYVGIYSLNLDNYS